MGATSDIDHLVNTCLAHAHTMLDDSGKGAFIDEALKRVAKKVENVTAQGEKIKNKPSVEALFKAHMLFGADDRLRMLAKILEMEQFLSHRESKQTIDTYRDVVLGRRNELGHMVLAPQGKPNTIETTEGKQVSLEEMRELRKQILQFREDFRLLVGAIKSS